MIRDAQAVEICHGEGAHGAEDPFRGYFIGVEDVTGPSDLEAPKKSSSEVGAPCLFNEAQHSLNRAFFQSRGELSWYEADVRKLTEERYALKLLSEQREGEVKEVRAELEVSRKEQAEQAEQVKQKFNAIRKLRVEVDAVKSEAEEWKKNMDCLASKKETARTQLASAEAQLRSLKEKALVQAKKIEELQSQLSSTNSDQERLATELAAAKIEVEKMMANANAMEVAEAAQARENWVSEHAKCRSRRETLEEIHARGFDLTTEIENAKELEAEARVLAFPIDDDTGKARGSESEGGLEGEDAAPGEH
uniref:Translation initiation factor IF-2-like n=1 Tax=Nicotiana tabacum TaxID=4097 RepID=A0A1S3Y2C1_TOBAC|nr:PREDICTED: translation initiation factor IF-2-like [Nicotiana tabacum]